MLSDLVHDALPTGWVDTGDPPCVGVFDDVVELHVHRSETPTVSLHQTVALDGTECVVTTHSESFASMEALTDYVTNIVNGVADGYDRFRAIKILDNGAVTDVIGVYPGLLPAGLSVEEFRAEADPIVDVLYNSGGSPGETLIDDVDPDPGATTVPIEVFPVLEEPPESETDQLADADTDATAEGDLE